MEEEKWKKWKNHLFFQRKILASCMEEEKNWFYYKTAAKTIGPRIRAVNLQYSQDMLWGTLTDKLFREKNKTRGKTKKKIEKLVFS